MPEPKEDRRDDGHTDSEVTQLPAVLGGPATVAAVDDPSDGSSFGGILAWVPGARAAVAGIGEFVTGLRRPSKARWELGEMLVENTQLPFELDPPPREGRADTRLFYDDGWELSPRAVRLFLAVELGVELYDCAGPEDRFIHLSDAFLARKGAVAQLERALRKLDHWRSDPRLLDWASGGR